MRELESGPTTGDVARYIGGRAAGGALCVAVVLGATAVLLFLLMGLRGFVDVGASVRLVFLPIFYLPLSLVPCAPFWWFGRRRVLYWCKWDFLVLILPYCVWVVLMAYDDTGKSMSNMCELVILAGATILSPVTRIALGRTLPDRAVAVVALLAVCAVGVALWYFVPGLPE